jgi:hypothetical protein
VIIDEITRADISQVFGPLYTAIEDDEQEIFRTDSGESLTLDERVKIVCTMNMSDRTVNELDNAITRRFAMIELSRYGEDARRSLFEDWIAELGPDVEIDRGKLRELFERHHQGINEGVTTSGGGAIMEFGPMHYEDVTMFLRHACGENRPYEGEEPTAIGQAFGTYLAPRLLNAAALPQINRLVSHYEDLSIVDRRRVAAQVRFAAPQVIHYYRLPDLPAVGATDLEELAGDRSGGGFGTQVRAVSEAHDRIYLVCSVPAGGTQAQLSVSEASRVRTVAAFDPGTNLLAVRAETPETAAGTVSACLDHPALKSSERVSFTEERFLRGFEDECVEAYTELGLGTTQPDARTARIDLTATELENSLRGDLREDEIVRDLLERGDTVRESAELRLALTLIFAGADGEEHDAIARPSVDVDFTVGSIAFDRFVPERTLATLDRIVHRALSS